MKSVIKIAAGASAILIVIILICFAIGPITNSNLRQFDDITAADLVALENRALHEGDREAAAKLYWYYRLNKQDYARARKWEYAVLRPGETNSDLPPN